MFRINCSKHTHPKIRTNRLSIKDWNIDDRPREKLIALGASALSNEELLAVLIGMGTQELSAVGLGRQLLDSVDGSLNELGRKDATSLMKFHGIGLAKGVSIAAALELGRRRKAEEIPQLQTIIGSSDIVSIFQPLLADLPHEEVWVMLLTSTKKIIERYRLSQGGLSEATIDTRLLMRRALERMAAAIILVHNHPSGTESPSEMDVANTRKVKIACSYFDIKLLDHVIITDKRSFSFAESGLL